MKLVQLALTASFGFAWKCGMIVIAVTLLTAMVPGEADDGPADPLARDLTGCVATPGGEVRVTMMEPTVAASSSCTLVDEHGRQLLQATYDRFGCLVVCWGDAFPFHPCCSASRDGSLNLGALDGTNRYELLLRPGGVSGVRATNTLSRECHGLGYNEQGELVVDPWTIGSHR